MIFTTRSAKHLFSLYGIPVLLLCAGILLMPLASGCSGKKGPKPAKNVSQKKPSKKAPAKKVGKTGKPAAKSAKKSAVPAVPAVFTKLTSYEGISLNDPFRIGEPDFLLKIEPAKGIRVFDTERLPGGKIVLDNTTLRIVRLETKKEYGSEEEASAAFEERKKVLEKSTGLSPLQGARGVSFTEMISDGRGRNLQLILSGSVVQEIVTAQAMPRAAAPAGKPIQGLFGLTLGMPIPPKQIDHNAMLLFHPDPARSEFTKYTYFNDEMGNVQSIQAASDPDRTICQEEALAVAEWLEEKFAMKMSYDGERNGSGVFRHSSQGRVLELRWKEGKLSLTAQISRPAKKK